MAHPTFKMKFFNLLRAFCYIQAFFTERPLQLLPSACVMIQCSQSFPKQIPKFNLFPSFQKYYRLLNLIHFQGLLHFELHFTLIQNLLSEDKSFSYWNTPYLPIKYCFPRCSFLTNGTLFHFLHGHFIFTIQKLQAPVNTKYVLWVKQLIFIVCLL